VGAFKKIVVPATALIAFAFLGFMKIGEDIENPFGYASNDLDLDHFCNDIILRELEELTFAIFFNPYFNI
jgi:predicted membrane chloride channel (bestrophin family)